jgi:hypothetical protein
LDFLKSRFFSINLRGKSFETFLRSKTTPSIVVEKINSKCAPPNPPTRMRSRERSKITGSSEKKTSELSRNRGMTCIKVEAQITIKSVRSEISLRKQQQLFSQTKLTKVFS